MCRGVHERNKRKEICGGGSVNFSCPSAPEDFEWNNTNVFIMSDDILLIMKPALDETYSCSMSQVPTE